MNIWPQTHLAQDPAEWLGDAHPLVQQLGTADGLASLHVLAESLRARPVASLPARRRGSGRWEIVDGPGGRR